MKIFKFLRKLFLTAPADYTFIPAPKAGMIPVYLAHELED